MCVPTPERMELEVNNIDVYNWYFFFSWNKIQYSLKKKIFSHSVRLS